MARRLVVNWTTGQKITARLDTPPGHSGVGILLAHGAGAGQDHPFMTTLRTALARNGLAVMTFNYAYTEAGRKAPDRLPKLLAVHRAAAERFSGYCDEIYLAGKSMGGRVASHLAGDEAWPASGMVYYGYPLVPMGKSEARDVAHLHEIKGPQLFFGGSRDRLGPPEMIMQLASSLPDAEAVIVEDGDHSFKVTKRAGRSHEEVIEDLASLTATRIAQPRPS